ncbi:MAG: hypothetical protein C4548_07145 [Desulfobacteraceae bacterium]|nr:MAG: hypothetical protein C4548_07145 [Desulfobacteraceae bacterium]
MKTAELKLDLFEMLTRLFITLAPWVRRTSLMAAMVLFLFALIPGGVQATWNLSVDGDARYRLTEWEEHDADIHLVGASVRKTFSDNKGDRLILFGLVEAEDNFSDVMLHEVYGQYKGPMGAWNITAGRFGLPWGLLPGFSASRLLYDMPHGAVLGMNVDNGFMLSGVNGPLDYAASITQGYGPRGTPDDLNLSLGTARIGFTPGDTEEFSIGVSAAVGKSIRVHAADPNGDADMNMDKDSALQRAVGGLDATLYLGRWLGRVELSAGRVDHRSMTAGFAAMDYALLPRFDLNFAANLVWHGSEFKDEWFAGFTGKPPWFTIRGGYRYAGNSPSHHEVIFQLYRLFSYNL